MEIVSVLLIFLMTVILFKIITNYLFTSRKENLPPSLPHIPIFGSMPFLPKLNVLHLFLTEKAKKHGNVMGLYLARRFAVVLSGREAIQEGLVKNAVEFAERPHYYLQKYLNNEKFGIVAHLYNNHFKKYHCLSLSILKKFGFGQGIMGQRIKREVEAMIDRIDKKKGEAFDPADIVTLCVSNVTMTIIFGKRMELEDKKFTDAIQIVHETLRDVESSTIINFFPFIRFLPKYKKVIEESKLKDLKVRKFIEEKIQESINEISEESFISCFIEELGADYETEQLLYTLRDLFLAGTETTSSTILWLLILFSNHQEVQKKAQKEIDSVISRNHLPTLDDKSKLKYVEAVIMESMRWKTIVPLSLLHVTAVDTTIQGKKIPAGTWVFPNIYSVHMDENVWKDPQTFCPERFIDKNGDVTNKNLIIPFSLGKRSCFGEGLARQEIYLFASALLHQYHILPPPGHDSISVEENVGVTISPKQFKIRLIKR